jgi:hypothetical protein
MSKKPADVQARIRQHRLDAAELAAAVLPQQVEELAMQFNITDDPEIKLKLHRELKDTAASLEEKKTADNFRAVLLPLAAQWLGQVSADPTEPAPAPPVIEVRRGTDPAKIEAAQEVADEVVPAYEPAKSKTPDMFALLLESVREL